MYRISPDNPVRRRIDFGDEDDVRSQARADNSANLFKEILERESKEMSKKYSFDFRNERPLPGNYEWSKFDGDRYIEMTVDDAGDNDDDIPTVRRIRTNDEANETGIILTNEIETDEDMPSMQEMNETTPKSNVEAAAVMMKRRRNNVDRANNKDIRRRL